MWCGIFAMNGDEEKYPIYGWKGNGWQELHNTTLVSTVHASTYNIPVVVIQRRAQLFAVRASPLHHVEIQKKKIYFRPVNQCHRCPTRSKDYLLPLFSAWLPRRSREDREDRWYGIDDRFNAEGVVCSSSVW